MTQELIDAINEQITYEYYSAHIYLAMATYCAENDLPGFENWFLVQMEEEQFHAKKFIDFLHDRDCKVVIKGFKDPKTGLSSLLETLQYSLGHEKSVTQRIYNLMSIAQDNKDFGALSFINWFVDEQVEEESSFYDMIGKVKLVGEKGQGIYMLDKEAATRVFTPPAQ